ncbi:MAG: phosphatidylinositol-glycan biosynthesis class S protein [Olpidium bornovanus]|uniref:Phosphatidylinositol-glycan biosynthesis class S protein n=1 Tax=Olpidium bornovanus TaxID=278681 RepID=A0A8H8DJ30_9FUNG|nr:MAG: phosphatidylinositol-glycan biosynthesis class S protein [Olpidium bornovanus]
MRCGIYLLLASAVTSDPSLNFVLYVPSAANSPLVVVDSTDKPVPSNAFLLPRWGGIVVDNSPMGSFSSTPGKSNEKFHYGVEDLRPVMQVFVAQLRGLLGVSALDDGFATDLKKAPVTMVVQNAPQRGVTDWEFDAVLRMRTAQNVVAAVATIKSLAALVRQIGNMVVLDHIRDEVIRTLNELKLSCAALHANSTLKAFAFSRSALEGAEKAFFDPTMVSMLYFPDEHKYAIYMPLFVPVSVPLVVTALKELKARMSARAEKRKFEKRKAE